MTLTDIPATMVPGPARSGQRVEISPPQHRLRQVVQDGHVDSMSIIITIDFVRFSVLAPVSSYSQHVAQGIGRMATWDASDALLQQGPLLRRSGSILTLLEPFARGPECCLSHSPYSKREPPRRNCRAPGAPIRDCLSQGQANYCS